MFTTQALALKAALTATAVSTAVVGGGVLWHNHASQSPAVPVSAVEDSGAYPDQSVVADQTTGNDDMLIQPSQERFPMRDRARGEGVAIFQNDPPAAGSVRVVAGTALAMVPEGVGFAPDVMFVMRGIAAANSVEEPFVLPLPEGAAHFELVIPPDAADGQVMFNLAIPVPEGDERPDITFFRMSPEEIQEMMENGEFAPGIPVPPPGIVPGEGGAGRVLIFRGAAGAEEGAAGVVIQGETPEMREMPDGEEEDQVP